MPLRIVQFAALKDNYNYLLHDDATGKTAVVDPSDTEGVLHQLAIHGWDLHFILNTHHHADHVGGNHGLKREFTDCSVVGYVEDASRIPLLDIPLQEGDRFSLGDSVAHILCLPGHTLGHIGYYFAGEAALFSGDVLFASGCGRLFEGTASQMARSLARIAELPDETFVYCAHEYTEANLRFARQILPQDEGLQQREKEVKTLRQNQQPTVPTTVGQEKQVNLFLRTHEPALATALGLPEANAVDVLAELRRLKDQF